MINNGRRTHEWRELTTTTANATCTATRAAQTGFRHVILGVQYSCDSDPATKFTVEVKTGTRVLDSLECPDQPFQPFFAGYGLGIEGDVNEAVSITVPALGVGARVSCRISGYTEKVP